VDGRRRFADKANNLLLLDTLDSGTGPASDLARDGSGKGTAPESRERVTVSLAISTARTACPEQLDRY